MFNILPHAITAFDPTRQLCRGDNIFSHAIVIVKWSNTIPNRKQYTTIDIPVLDHCILCPVKALKKLQIIPGKNNDLFHII